MDQKKHSSNNKSKKATIFDVARLAGVSISSVSRVINNSVNVKSNIKTRILSAIDKLNYRPSLIAQGLARKNMKTIAIIITDITNPFFTQLVHGAESKTNEYGYNLIFCNTDESAEKEAKYIRILSNNMAAGFIISATRMTNENIYELKKTDVPFVMINRYLSGDDSPCVRTDFNAGSQLAVSHLVEIGREKILLLNGPANSQAGHLREEGYINAVAKHGLLYNPDLNRSYQPTVEGGFNGIIEALEIGTKFDALIAYNDLMAVGALDALRNRGIKVPDDIAVVSFDDTILATHTYPTLTSIRQDSELLGRLAVEMLISIVEGKELKVRDLVIKPELIIRESSSIRKN
jgi:LacI family transcriptional regulator